MEWSDVVFQLVGEILEMVLDGFNLMDWDDSILKRRSLVDESLAGFRVLAVSGSTGSDDGDLLYALGKCNIGGILCVYYGLSLCCDRPSHQRLDVKGLRSVNVSIFSTCVASYDYY